MADRHQNHQAASLCLVGAMDRLWFRQAVFFPEPISLPCLKSPHLISDSAVSPRSEHSSKPLLSDHEEISSVLAQQQQGEAETIKMMEEEIIIPEDGSGNRPTRISQTSRKARSKSHSPKLERRQSKTIVIKDSTSSKRLEKTISSKTYEDLEQEEVKGFIDLGFRFNKEHISPRMMTVVPGLQRIIKTSPKQAKGPELVAKPEIEYVDKNEVGAITIMRPYLSRAWLIKRPDSPLLSMRMRRGYAAADMKKQLKSWARTVAIETIQES